MAGWALSILLHAAAVPSGNAPVAEVVKELQSILTAQAQGSIGERRLIYQELARKQPSDPLPRVFLAWCDMPSDDAWNQLKGIATIHPDNPWVHYGMGSIYTLWKMKDQARGELELILKKDPNFYPAYVTLGELAGQGGDAAKAEQHFRAALKLRGDDARALGGLGLSLLGKGDKAAARPLLEKAAESWPEQQAVVRALFELSKAESDVKSATRYGAALAQLLPKDREARRALADLRFDQGDKAEAAKEYERLLRLGDPEVPVLNRLADIYREAADAEAEERTQQQLAAVDKANPQPCLRLAELQLARGATEAGEGQLLEAIARAPTSAQAHLLLGRSRAKRDSLYDAAESYRAATAGEGTFAAEARAEGAQLEKRFRLPAKKPKGDVNAINWVVSGTLNDLYAERRRQNSKLANGGLLRLRVKVDPQGAVQAVDVLKDTVGDSVLVAHAYFALKDAQYEKKKREAIFEFELKGRKK